MNERPARSALRAGVVLLGIAGFAVTGCSAEEEPSPSAEVSTTTTPTASGKPQPSVPTRVRIAQVDGKLSDPARAMLRSKVKKVVDTWIDAAYLGEFPRQDFAAAYAGFSAGAKQQALRNKGFLSNAAIAGRIESATASERRVDLDVVAARGHAIGVTARVRLVFETTGELERTDKVEGRLYLSRDRSDPLTWRVFGYDMTRSEVR